MGDELSPDVPAWPVRARRPLTEERIVTAAQTEHGTSQAQQVLSMHHMMRERTRLYAQHLAQIASFLAEDAGAAGVDEADLAAVKVATGLRVTTNRAESLIRDAHRAVERMPGTFAVLTMGDLPEDWHHSLLARVRGLTEEQTGAVDRLVADWDLASISWSQFDRHLRHAIALVTAGELPTPPETRRRVDLEIADAAAGTGCLTVTGPLTEIKSLAHRLDEAARTVQKAQRAALDDDEDGPIPFDIDENLRERGRPMSLAALRYAILTHSMLDIDPVQETRSPFRMFVTVPAMTLLGATDAPGMIDGLTPIPADQARALAAEQDLWHRILTDPATGAHLDAAATTYRPSAQIRDQLRLRHPVCAAPGCTRATVLGAEDDHIHEFDHGDPSAGGLTILINLHRLCWRHHQQKTAGLIDPERDGPDPGIGGGTPARAGTAGPTVTTWDLGDGIRTTTREDTDLVTPLLVTAFDAAWDVHQRTRDEALRQRDAELDKPRHRRVIEQRAEEHRRFRPRRPRVVPPERPGDGGDDPPPF